MIEIYVESEGDVWVGAAIEDKQVLATAFNLNEENLLTKLFERIPFDKPFQTFSEPSIFSKGILTSIRDIYLGKNVSNDLLPLSTTHLPVYTQKVLETVRKIPVGYVSTYGSIAEATNGGARAVGNIMANNRFPLIVPCHRVVAAGRRIGGYGGGLKPKMELLKRERRNFSEAKEIIVEQSKLSVFPVEFLLGNINRFGELNF